MQLDSGFDMSRCVLIAGEGSSRAPLGDLLQRLGFELHATPSPQSALDICIDQAPELIVLPARMEGMEAAEFIRRARVAPRTKEAVMLVYGGGDNADPRALGRAVLAGAAEVMMQPFDEEILKTKLRRTGVM